MNYERETCSNTTFLIFRYISNLKPQYNEIMRGVRAKILRNLKLMKLLSESVIFLEFIQRSKKNKKLSFLIKEKDKFQFQFCFTKKTETENETQIQNNCFGLKRL